MNPINSMQRNIVAVSLLTLVQGNSVELLKAVMALAYRLDS